MTIKDPEEELSECEGELSVVGESDCDTGEGFDQFQNHDAQTIGTPDSAKKFKHKKKKKK